MSILTLSNMLISNIFNCIFLKNSPSPTEMNAGQRNNPLNNTQEPSTKFQSLQLMINPRINFIAERVSYNNLNLYLSEDCSPYTTVTLPNDDMKLIGNDLRNGYNILLFGHKITPHKITYFCVT